MSMTESPRSIFFLCWLFSALLRPTNCKSKVDLCEYYRAIHKLNEHPECIEEETSSTTAATPRDKAAAASSASSEEGAEQLPSCSASEECPSSGQLCTQSDGTQCCQDPLQGIPVSHINAKSGNCPPPIGISTLQDGNIGCWLDTNCPGIQKCCLEPNPVSNIARRICRDPEGVSSDSICTLPVVVGTCTAFVTRYYFDASTGKCKSFQYSGCGGNANNFQSLQSCHSTCGLLGVKGTPSCPGDANAELNCLLPHADACHNDPDCMGREGGQQPSCCMTKCGYRICYIY
uniref:BPTI/Kunitz inhibitor domain-containing protein n=1 Tax=Globodera rostochiensis TaxID=31243 RepID=A0A914ICG3_GLORO